MGASLDYPAAGGGHAVFVLGPLYRSGWQIPCRIGRLHSGQLSSGAPSAYAFCREGTAWYLMNPVVVSGF